MAYRRRPAPVPPPIGGIVVDGSNVIASGLGTAAARIERVEDWCLAFGPDLPITVFFDAGRRTAPAALRAPPPRVERVLCRSGENADAALLEAAAARRAIVVSNDRFFDHAELRADLLTLQFELRRGSFAPYPYATWFRRRGTAVLVPLDVLRTRHPTDDA